MNANEDVENVDRDGWFVKAAGMVGDLGNPFYREERQRDVWNEASAVGLQLVLWLGLGAIAAMVWLGGPPALPYAVAVFLVLGAASGVSVLYAHKLGVRLDDAGRVLRLRLVPYCVLLMLFLVGVMRAAPTSGFGAGFARGAPAGGAVAVLWLVWSGLRARRRSSAARSELGLYLLELHYPHGQVRLLDAEPLLWPRAYDAVRAGRADRRHVRASLIKVAVPQAEARAQRRQRHG